MAGPLAYGDIEVAMAQGKPKLTSVLSPKVRINVNKFDFNNVVYIHINSRNKSISLTWEEYEKLCNAKQNLNRKLHFIQPPVFQPNIIQDQQLAQQAAPQLPQQAAPQLPQQAAPQLPQQAAPSQNVQEPAAEQANPASPEVAEPQWEDSQYF